MPKVHIVAARVVSVALLAVIVAAAGTTADAAAPNSADSVAPTVPDEWQHLVDDTNLLTVSVPPSWNDVSTEPDAFDDGQAQASIMAATDLDTFRSTFDAPGLAYFVVPYNANLEGALDQHGLQGGCTTPETEPYDDGAFHGAVRHWTDCGESWVETEVYNVAVSPPDDSMTLILYVQITKSNQRPVVDAILSSFNLTHLPSLLEPAGSEAPPAPSNPTVVSEPTVSAVPADTGTTTGTDVPPSTESPAGSEPATGSDPSATTTLTDDLGALAVDVPSDWVEVDTAPGDDGYGNPTPYVGASPDWANFLPGDGRPDNLAVPGVIFRALPRIDELAAYLNTIEMVRCTDGGIETYEDDLFTGFLHRYADCGDAGARTFVIVANPRESEAFTALLVIRVVDADDADFDVIQQSFSYSPAAVETLMGDAPSASTVAGVAPDT